MYLTKSRTKKIEEICRKSRTKTRTKRRTKKSDQKSDKKSDKLIYSYFEKVHATIPKGIVSGFEFTVVQRNLKELMAREAMDACLRVLKESSKSRFDGYCVRNSVLMISHVAFRNCRVHIFSDNLSRNSCIQNVGQKIGQKNATRHKHAL